MQSIFVVNEARSLISNGMGTGTVLCDFHLAYNPRLCQPYRQTALHYGVSVNRACIDSIAWAVSNKPMRNDRLVECQGIFDDMAAIWQPSLYMQCYHHHRQQQQQWTKSHLFINIDEMCVYGHNYAFRPIRNLVNSSWQRRVCVCVCARALVWRLCWFLSENENVSDRVLQSFTQPSHPIHHGPYIVLQNLIDVTTKQASAHSMCISLFSIHVKCWAALTRPGQAAKLNRMFVCRLPFLL